MPRPLVALVLLALAGCGDPPAPTAATPPPADPSRPTDTDKLRAASAIGYDGDALQRGVQRVQQQADEQARQTDAAARDAAGR